MNDEFKTQKDSNFDYMTGCEKNKGHCMKNTSPQIYNKVSRIEERAE